MGTEYVYINKMQPVEVSRTFLGIKKGTILKFDPASSKYVSMAREEEIGDGEYYYSGFAIAIDPDIIDKNVGHVFRVLPKLNTNKDEATANKYEATEEIEEKVATKEVGYIGREDSPEKYWDEDKTLKENKTKDEGAVLNNVEKNYVLKFRCGLCGEENYMFETDKGLFLPASNVFNMKLKCSVCGNTSELYYDEVS